MASDLDISPPEVLEPMYLGNLLWYRVFLGAIFQLICMLAIIIPVPKSHKAGAEPPEPQSAEVTRKPKVTAPLQTRDPRRRPRRSGRRGSLHTLVGRQGPLGQPSWGTRSQVSGLPSDCRDVDNHDSAQSLVGRPPLLPSAFLRG